MVERIIESSYHKEYRIQTQFRRRAAEEIRFVCEGKKTDDGKRGRKYQENEIIP